MFRDNSKVIGSYRSIHIHKDKIFTALFSSLFSPAWSCPGSPKGHLPLLRCNKDIHGVRYGALRIRRPASGKHFDQQALPQALSQASGLCFDDSMNAQMTQFYRSTEGP